MRITLDVTPVIYGTGVSRYTSNLAKALILQLSKTDSLTLFGTSLRQKAALQSLVKDIPQSKTKLYPFPPTATSLFFNQLNLPIELFSGQTDIFHAWDWYVPRAQKASLVTTVHDLALFKFPDTAHPQIKAHHQQALKRIKKYGYHVISVSESTKKDLVEMFDFDPNTITVIHSALPEEFKRDVTPPEIDKVKSKFQVKKPYFLIVGTKEPRKNIPTMVAAWQHFKGEFDLVIAGKEAWEEIKPQPGLIQTGYLQDQQLSALYAGASTLLYASLYEGFGLPILEAFHYRIPVVTSNTSSMPEIAGKAAVLVEPTDPDSLIKGIQTALDNRQRLIEAGQKQLSCFSWDTVAQTTLQLYHSLVAQP